MSIPTYEQVVQEFHKQTLYHKTGSYPRPIKDFNKTKYNKNKEIFEKFILTVKRNQGHIDWKLMIEALADFFKGYFNPSFLSNQKGIRIYKNYILEKSKVKNENIQLEVKRSIKNIVQYMNENNIKDIEDYLTEGQYLLPTIGKHLSGGTISPYFLVMVPDIKSIINALPPDMKSEYFTEFLENYDLYRAKLIRFEKLRIFSDKFYKLFKV